LDVELPLDISRSLRRASRRRIVPEDKKTTTTNNNNNNDEGKELGDVRAGRAADV